MKFTSLSPFVPSGSDFEGSRQLFLDLDFSIVWDAGDYIKFDRDGCSFILQKYDNIEFAQNLMINVNVDDVAAFWEDLKQKDLAGKHGIKLTEPKLMPYGKEVNLIDLAGVCWHFVQ